MEETQEKSQKVQKIHPKQTEVEGPTGIPFKNMAELSREMMKLKNGKIHGNVWFWNKKIRLKWNISITIWKYQDLGESCELKTLIFRSLSTLFTREGYYNNNLLYYLLNCT